MGRTQCSRRATRHTFCVLDTVDAVDLVLRTAQLQLVHGDIEPDLAVLPDWLKFRGVGHDGVVRQTHVSGCLLAAARKLEAVIMSARPLVDYWAPTVVGSVNLELVTGAVYAQLLVAAVYMSVTAV